MSAVFKPKGYPLPSCYMGLLPDGRWMMFTTEAEYWEYLNEEEC